MCGRYSIFSPAEMLAERFGAELPAEPLPAVYNAAPTQHLPVLLNRGPRVIRLLRWGLIPNWAQEKSIGNRMINARAETLLDKPSFRDPFRLRRCLVLADGFFEWKKTGKEKLPVRFTRSDAGLFAFAGLWDSWKAPGNEIIPTFTIITTKPNTLTAAIHDRMPVILSREEEAVWLDKNAPEEVLLDLLDAYPAEQMRAYRVSKRVNTPANNEPDLVEPLPEPDLN